MACHLLGAKPLSKPMMGYDQLIHGNKLHWNFNEDTKLSIRKNASKNIFCEMAASLSRGRWVYQHLWCYGIIRPQWVKYFPLCASDMWQWTALSLVQIMSLHQKCSTITWINVDLLPTGPLETHFVDIWSKKEMIFLKKMHFKMSSLRLQPFSSRLDLSIEIINKHTVLDSSTGSMEWDVNNPGDSDLRCK